MAKHRRPPFRLAAICECGGHGFVGLTLGRVALFSPADLNAVIDRNWSTTRKSCLLGYARSRSANGSTHMHRLIMAVRDDEPEVVDHINHDTLDNRRDNLRVCSKNQNQKNRLPSKARDLPKGVYQRDNGSFVAMIGVNGSRVSCGTHATVYDAAMAYNDAAVKYHGEFARINSVQE